MARSGQHALHTINPVSYGTLAILFVAAEIVAKNAIPGPIVGLIMALSGVLFGLGLGAMVSGRDSGNKLISSLVLTAYAALVILNYWIQIMA